MSNTVTATQKKTTVNLQGVTTEGKTFTAPDYSIKEVLQAIPKDCYERRLSESFYYVFRDIAIVVASMATAQYAIPLIGNVYLRGVTWFLYSVYLSLPLTGLWVLAHECGHQAFSDYGWVNDTVGWVLHSYLMVPYFSWKYSHGKHHKATGHLTRDMVFVPPTKEQFIENHQVVTLGEIACDAPIVTLANLFIQQFGGWIWHLLTNVTGQPFKELEGSFFKQFYASHFNPSAPIFEKRDYWFIVLSDIGILTQTYILYNWINYFGTFSFVVHWLIPYLFTNHWLVFVTFLQHTDVSLPHYEDSEWTFARGAAATIDREFGFIGPFFFHDIIETHVLHHYCSRIPFYNARKASKAIKEVMGDNYAHSDESMWFTLWNSARQCQFVDGKNGMKMFRNVNGLGVDPTKE